MSNRSTNNAMTGFLIGYMARRGFDDHNQKMLLEQYKQTGEIPKKKSLPLALFLTFIFGGFGLLYSAPKTAIPFTVIEIFLMLFFFLGILLRPIALFITFVAVLSQSIYLEDMEGKGNERIGKVNHARVKPVANHHFVTLHDVQGTVPSRKSNTNDV